MFPAIINGAVGWVHNADDRAINNNPERHAGLQPLITKVSGVAGLVILLIAHQVTDLKQLFDPRSELSLTKVFTILALMTTHSLLLAAFILGDRYDGNYLGRGLR